MGRFIRNLFFRNVSGELNILVDRNGPPAPSGPGECVIYRCKTSERGECI